MYNKKEIGKRLEIFAEKIGNKTELAKQLGVTPQSLTDYFNGKTTPGEKWLIKLENLGCDVRWLMFGNDDSVTKPVSNIEIRLESIERKLEDLEAKIDKILAK